MTEVRTITETQDPLQIVAKNGDNFQVTNNLAMLVEQLPNDMEIAVLSMNGPFRTGKSFLLSLFVRSLFRMAGVRSDRLDYFKWAHGRHHETEGVWCFPPFILNRGGQEFALLIMDCQGVFDYEANHATSVFLFGLATLVSSFQIYNIEKRIQDDDLQHLALFSEFANIVMQQSAHEVIKPFQHVDILVRDWQDTDFFKSMDQYKDSCETYTREVLYPDDSKLRKNRNRIMDCYRSMDINVLPYPGEKVSEGEIEGSVVDIRESFLEYAGNYLFSILNKIQSKKVFRDPFTKHNICNYFNSFIKVLNSDKIPEPKTVLAATVEAVHQNSINAAVSLYSRLIEKVSDISKFEADDQKAYQSAITLFQDRAVIGTSDEKFASLNKLKELLEEQGKSRRSLITVAQARKLSMYIILLIMAISILTVKASLLTVCTTPACSATGSYLGYAYNSVLGVLLCKLGYTLGLAKYLWRGVVLPCFIKEKED